MISYGRQDITKEDIKAVKQALKSDFLTQGLVVPEFEQQIATYCHASHAVAFSNATAALHSAYNALDISLGDLVWTSPNTFVATANAARMLGAKVDFVDINPNTLNICVKLLKQKLEVAAQSGNLPKLIVPVHFSGQSCDMEEIWKLSKEYGFSIVEDASHAIGGKYKDIPVGSCKYSDITIFSFHPVKIITTAEGGMATTNNPILLEKMVDFRSHGVTRNVKKMKQEPDGPWYYEMLSLGFNYRMTEIQAALGLSQLKRLGKYIIRRNEIAKLYDEKFAELPILLPQQEKWQYSAFHLYVIQWPDGVGGRNRKQAFNALRKAEIGVNVHYIPVHLQPYYRKLGFEIGDFPNAENYYSKAITLPLHPKLSDDELDKIISTLKNIASC